MGSVGAGRWDLVFPSGAPDRVGDMFATAVVADAVRRYDADLAQWVETCRDWSRQYRPVFRGMTALAASSPDASVGSAREGLRAARNLLRFVTGDTVEPLRGVEIGSVAADVPATGTARGTGKPARRLEVPFRGAVLAEEALQRELTDWRQRGIVEPGFAAAVERVIDHPEWLALPGFRVVVAGAGELTPLRPLLRWGADVLAVARPGPARWRELVGEAEAGGGVLRYPLVDGQPGSDITTQFPALVHWIREHLGGDTFPVFGGYVTRRGPGGVRLAVALDLLAADLLTARPDTALAGFGSPTDCYAVPESVVAQAHSRLHGRGPRGIAQAALRVLTRSALYRPNYRTRVIDAEGACWSVADALFPPQGPNHVLAQRILRWRAIAAQDAGHTVSYTVAPPTWTRPVLSQRSLAAAYRSAHRFGMQIFEPDTARTLLAAKLVADLNDPAPAAPNPESLFAVGAAHGGLWSLPFEPRSLLPVAIATGHLRGLLHADENGR
ncbi:hypothetical protein [Nocardia amikacinitolerans]|uniref:hypothetical protein n=1 Tax=Nocardia amikacinitolerans TaxID=756689 RepID=UPI0020A297D3|nr:hypothetical protein [Nocardia amikacinitolerans]MCP2290332.1 hypothetical protein [Nocardia amikacinitolerans]